MIRLRTDIADYGFVLSFSELVPLRVLVEQSLTLLLIDLVPDFFGAQLVELPQFTQLVLSLLLELIELFGL